MKYRYKKNQIFRKKLNLPNEILNKVYSSTLSFEEFIKYELTDKVPIDVIDYNYKPFVKMLGIEKCKELDFEFINDAYTFTLNLFEQLKDINQDNLMKHIYERAFESIIADEFSLIYHENMSERFKKLYPQLFLDKTVPENLKSAFYSGNLSLNEIIENWVIFKDKNINRSLKNYNLSKDLIAEFIKNYQEIIFLFNHDFLRIIKMNKEEQEKLILDIIKHKINELSNNEFKKIFSVIDFKKFLSVLPTWYDVDKLDKLVEKNGLETILNSNFDFSILFDSDVLSFIYVYGFKNITEFDQKSEGFFSNNNYKVLKEIFENYMHYGGNIHDKEKCIYTKNTEDGNYDREYTKEEFYEALRRMCLYGPTNWDYHGFNYKEIQKNKEFRELNKDLFLSENAPDELCDLYYSSNLDPNILKANPDWLNYLDGKDISRRFSAQFSFFINGSEIFMNKTLIFIYDALGEEIFKDEEYLKFLKTKKVGLIDIKTLKILSYEYFKETNESLKYLYLLIKIGFENEYTKNLQTTFSQILKRRPQLSLNNPALSGKILKDEIIHEIGIDTINILFEYNSGAHKVILDCYENGKLKPLAKFINYIKKTSIFSDKVLHFSILSYTNSNELFESLSTENVVLDNNLKDNLSELLIQRNKYGVKTIDELKDYRGFRNTKLENQINSEEIKVVKDAISEIIFNVSFYDAQKIVETYSLDKPLFVKNILIQNNILSIEDYGIIKLVKELVNTNDLNELKDKFKISIKNPLFSDSLLKIEKKMLNYFNMQYKKALFKDDKTESDGLKHLPSINYENTEIPVIELCGAEFFLIIHKLHSYDPTFANLASRISENPELWNQLEGASTLSTSMISDFHMMCVANGNCEAVYYGFNELGDNSIILMGPRDIYVEHGGAKLEPRSNINKFMSPSLLQLSSTNYNEIALDRKSSANKDIFDGRIQPTCMISFHFEVNEATKKAAAYFKIPIYIINKAKYQEKNDNLEYYYSEDQPQFIDEVIIKNIIYKIKLPLAEKYEKCINKTKLAFNNGLIDKKQLIENIKTIKIYVSDASSTLNDNIDINMLHELEELLNNNELEANYHESRHR